MQSWSQMPNIARANALHDLHLATSRVKLVIPFVFCFPLIPNYHSSSSPPNTNLGTPVPSQLKHGRDTPRGQARARRVPPRKLRRRASGSRICARGRLVAWLEGALPRSRQAGVQATSTRVKGGAQGFRQGLSARALRVRFVLQTLLRHHCHPCMLPLRQKKHLYKNLPVSPARWIGA